MSNHYRGRSNSRYHYGNRRPYNNGFWNPRRNLNKNWNKKDDDDLECKHNSAKNFKIQTICSYCPAGECTNTDNDMIHYSNSYPLNANGIDKVTKNRPATVGCVYHESPPKTEDEQKESEKDSKVKKKPICTHCLLGRCVYYFPPKEGSENYDSHLNSYNKFLHIYGHYRPLNYHGADLAFRAWTIHQKKEDEYQKKMEKKKKDANLSDDAKKLLKDEVVKHVNSAGVLFAPTK